MLPLNRILASAANYLYFLVTDKTHPLFCACLSIAPRSMSECRRFKSRFCLVGNFDPPSPADIKMPGVKENTGAGQGLRSLPRWHSSFSMTHLMIASKWACQPQYIELLNKFHTHTYRERAVVCWVILETQMMINAWTASLAGRTVLQQNVSPKDFRSYILRSDNWDNTFTLATFALFVGVRIGTQRRSGNSSQSTW